MTTALIGAMWVTEGSENSRAIAVGFRITPRLEGGGHAARLVFPGVPAYTSSSSASSSSSAALNAAATAWQPSVL